MSETSDGKKVFNWGQFWTVGLIALVLGGIFVYGFFPRQETATPTGNATQGQIDAAVAAATASKDSQISDLQKQISDLKEGQPSSGEGGNIIENTGYKLDSLFLAQAYSKTLSDRELNLFDGSVEFNGEDYDAEEIFSLDGVEQKANENDFEGNIYLTAPRDSIYYGMSFESLLVTLDIGEGDNGTVTFNFLGKEIEVSSWDSNRVVLAQGEKHLLNEGQSVTVEGKNVTLTFVGDGEIVVKVDGVSDSIDEGKTRTINGLEILASDVLYSNYRAGQADLRIGKDIQQVIYDGDDYNSTSYWKWKINSSSIGLVLSEDFTQLDEDFEALNQGDQICLPNKYVCVVYGGLVNNEYESYSFDLDDGYVRVSGKFISGIDSHDRIYINRTGTTAGKIFYKDGSNYVLIGNSVDLEDTDSNITTDSTWITANDFRVNLDLANSEWNNGTAWLSLDSTDVDHRTNYGILIKDPEQASTDNEFSVSVPDERAEGFLVLRDVGFKEETTSSTTNSTA